MQIKPFFEGWYLKHQIGNDIYSFIISFHMTENNKKYAFIQFISNNCSHFKRFDAGEFVSDPHDFNVAISNNQFSSDGIRTNIDFDGVTVKCNIKYIDITPLKSDILGPFKYVPFMECRHKIISLTHKLSGFIEINGKKITLDEGVGYIESDKGKSFPKEYFWTQVNFERTNALMFAYAKVPLFLGEINGIICEILHDGKHYRLATYNNAKIIEHSDKHIIIKKGNEQLKIKILSQNPHKLYAPSEGDMNYFINESASCTAKFTFSIDKNVIFDFISQNASFEYHKKP